MTHRNTHRNTAIANDPGPRDIDAFRFGLIRRMSDIHHEWRTCDEPACPRVRACVAANLACSAGPPTSTPEQQQRAVAALYHMLQQRRAQAEKNLEAEEQAPAEKRRRGREPMSRSTTRRTGGRGRR
jgi:hypothetical protein